MKFAAKEQLRSMAAPHEGERERERVVRIAKYIVGLYSYLLSVVMTPIGPGV